ncbi:ABC-2 family transporter protein [Candidatus Woesearchaeota archaeon]|nr:ABC-2 family transporter protein [Candidatus Woesearchaeota archaeon]
MKLMKLEAKAAALDLSRELAYKGNFILKCLAFVITDFIGPVLTLLIYNSTLGIPGWSFYELLLFQGTLTIVFGLGHLFVLALPYTAIHAIDRGEFDKYLVKPYSPLLYLITQSILVEGVVEVGAGVFIAALSIVKLGLPVFSMSFFSYLFMIFLGIVFQVAVMVLIASLSFFIVKADALMNLYFRLSDFARWPISIYGPLLKIFLVFLFPVAVSSFFPAEVLLRGLSLPVLFQAFIPVAVFFLIAVAVWNLAMRRYASAGG